MPTLTVPAFTAEAVQTTLDSASPGDTVLLPAGVYQWDRLATYPSHVTIQGEPGTILVNTLDRTDSTHMLAPASIGVEDVVITGLWFDQRADHYDTAGHSMDAWCVSVNATVDVTIAHCVFARTRTMAVWADAYTVDPTVGHKAHHNLILDTGGGGLSYFGAFTGFEIHHNWITGTRDDPIAIQTSTAGEAGHGVIHDNQIAGCVERTSYGSTPRGICMWGATDVTVEDNTIDRVFGSGLYTADGSTAIFWRRNKVRYAGHQNTTEGPGTFVPAFGAMTLGSSDVYHDDNDIDAATCRNGGYFTA